MIKINITPLFLKCQVKIIAQYYDPENDQFYFEARYDKRHIPRCHECGNQSKNIHSYDNRIIRDLDIMNKKVYINIEYRKIRCKNCGCVRVEDLGILTPHQRFTDRLAQYVILLCKEQNIKWISNTFDLNRITIKNIHKNHLMKKYKTPDYSNLRIIAIDEISMKKGHKYLTNIINYETGEVVYVGEGRKYRTLARFFRKLKAKEKRKIEAVCIDMWKPYIKAIKKHLPNAAIVFDLFHIVQMFGRIIDKVRISEYKKLSKDNKDILKGVKYILLRNKRNLGRKDKARLEEILDINKNLSLVYIIKDYIKKLWYYKYPKYVIDGITDILNILRTSGNKILVSFAKRLNKYSYGIINHCKYKINTSFVEGINNKIKVIKRKAYGFHDIQYFKLIIMDSFGISN